ncbi:hypothetical protein IPZ58_26990 [Streptomyces roseoverticillatus]|uniref:hypothetical protein n=1 Tax=Streptomyces roseoverticillatus TaxID=66429 RepID=UPI001F3C576D|nr:hypothetical protein [Streptomyces roseoverticillatus]MCF3105210.1 hypothetical protein [Streptomyces roseoverticillatus]
MNARTNAHPYDNEDTRTGEASCLTCAVLVMRRAAALRQGLAAVQEVENRRREHVRNGHR